MKHIVLDTNFLLIPAQLKVDIFSEVERIMHEKYDLSILASTLRELDIVAEKGRQKEKVQVKLTKALIKTQNIKIVSGDHEKGVDDQLVELSKKGYMIATRDKELKKRIKNNILTLRQGKYIILK